MPGFRLDGSLASVGASSFDATGFANSLAEIRDGSLYFQSGCLYNRAAMLQLEILADELKARGIDLVVILPPLAPTAYRMFMSAPDSVVGYYRRWRADMEARGFLARVEVHDHMDGALLGADDDEFSDAIHIGEVGEARSLLNAALKSGSRLAQWIDRPIMDRFIAEKPHTISTGVQYFRSLKPPMWGGNGRGN